jgi:hypothetical protein
MASIFFLCSAILIIQGYVLYKDAPQCTYKPTIFKCWIIYIILTVSFYIYIYTRYNKCAIHIHHSTLAFHGALSLCKPSKTILQVFFIIFIGIMFQGIATYGNPITVLCMSNK